jgi:nicotinate-nucleotide pyrophosphorylase (carboxylating)
MDLQQFIKESLAEDVGTGDHTSLATISHNKIGKARLLVKEDGILAGVRVAIAIFKEVNPGLKVDVKIADGESVKHGDEVLYVEGPIQNILKAERLVLNCMQRMSGIATTTRKYVDAISSTKAKILDTRKTTPLMRALEKEAVKLGGALNHRFGLYDMILIKDNHVDGAGGIKNAIDSATKYLKENSLKLPIVIETRNIEEVKQVLEIGGIQRIMLDNFSPSVMKEAIELINGKFATEASGGITLSNILEYANTGIDYISVGALTHSVKSLDLSLKII